MNPVKKKAATMLEVTQIAQMAKMAKTLPIAPFKALAFSALLTCSVAPQAHAAGPQLDAVTVDALGGQPLSQAAEVVIRTNGTPDFNLFRLSNPTRVVIDLPGMDVAGVDLPATGALGSISTGSLISNITTTQFRGQAGPVGRVVMVIRGEVELDATKHGHAVVVRLHAKGDAVQKASPAPAVPTEKTAAAVPVIELSGEGKADAATRLLGVTAKKKGEGAIVNIRTNGVIARYEIEEVSDPPRLVVDIYGVKASKDHRVPLYVDALSRARVGKKADRTRIVLDARTGDLPRYDVAATGNGLSILFAGREVSAQKASTTAALTHVQLVKKGAFDRLALSVTGPVAVRTVASSPTSRTIVLDGVNAAKTLNSIATLKGKTIEGVQVTPLNAHAVQVKVASSRGAEHAVWQKNGKVYWDVRGAKSANAKGHSSAVRPQPRAAGYAATIAQAAHAGSTARRFRGRKITIDLMDADIINVLRLLGDVSGKNVVVGEDVKGKITIKLKNVPWDQALDVILRTKSLGKEVRGGIVRIAPQKRLDDERQARLKLQKDIRDKQPTTVRLIPVNYAVAGELVPQIEKLLSKDRGRVTFDERTNVIIVEDIRDNLDQSERLVRTLDTQTPQVLIEARMVEAESRFVRQLGIQWGGSVTMSERGGNPTGLIFPARVGLVGGADDPTSIQGGTGQPGIFAPSNFAINMPAAAATSALGLNLGAIGNYGFLNARLSAAQSTGEAKIISAPRVTTLNNKAAKIKQGTEFLFPIISQNQSTVERVEANLELEVTPHVTADGSVLMDVRMSNNRPNFAQQVSVVPPIEQKEAETEMLIKDGDTAVIGGIYTRVTSQTYAQTPLLGSIPVIGWLFKSSTTQDTRNELLVFITPRIINRRGSAVSQ